jgi:hypothetical protein
MQTRKTTEILKEMLTDLLTQMEMAKEGRSLLKEVYQYLQAERKTHPPTTRNPLVEALAKVKLKQMEMATGIPTLILKKMEITTAILTLKERRTERQTEILMEIPTLMEKSTERLTKRDLQIMIPTERLMMTD